MSRAILLYSIVAAGWLLFLWLKPRRQYVRQHARDRADARRIVLETGTDTLDYFALRRDKDYFFAAERDAFIAYRVSGGVALISGDPVGPHVGVSRSWCASFVEFGHRHGWRIAAIGVGPDFVPTYEAAGLRTVYIGDEAVVDPRTFSLEGRAIRKVRQSVNRLQKAGYTVIVRRRDELTPELLSGLLRVSQLWLGGQPERGFSMAMDDLWAPEHASAVFAIALAADGRPHGFIHFVPVPQARSLSLSAMRRLPDTPNGLMEFLLCETFAWGREQRRRARVAELQRVRRAAAQRGGGPAGLGAGAEEHADAAPTATSRSSGCSGSTASSSRAGSRATRRSSSGATCRWRRWCC